MEKELFDTRSLEKTDCAANGSNFSRLTSAALCLADVSSTGSAFLGTVTRRDMRLRLGLGIDRGSHLVLVAVALRV